MKGRKSANAKREPARRKPQKRGVTRGRLPDPAESARQYESIALLLQGGGALGAYQCGVYEALHEVGIAPDWFAGISIGAVNAAILAGNAPERRVERLRDFWSTICEPAGSLSWPAAGVRALLAWLPPSTAIDAWANGLGALAALIQGQRGFFEVRPLPPIAYADGSAEATSVYDTAPLRATLERLIDFDRINSGRSGVRLAIGATHVTTGNFHYFDNATTRIGPEHVMASGALPPGFPAVQVDGEPYWDGGLVSNTPLEYVLESEPRRDTLALQVDLWSARGSTPRTLLDVLERQKDIQYSSRTRRGTDVIANHQHLRNTLAELLKQVPAATIPANLRARLQPWLCEHVFNIVHLIYRAKPYEEQYKDYAFGPGTMREHWAAGYADMQHSLQHPEFFVPPTQEQGALTHDIHRVS